MRAMKDSGIEWIGEIPESWSASRVGNLYSFSSGDTLTNEEIADEGDYTVYGANGVRGYYNKYNLSGQHILIGRVGALCGNVHITDGEVWVTEHALICFNKHSVCDSYFGYVFSAMNLGQYSKASAQPVISSNTISRLRMPIPSVPEQQAISAYLDRQCSHIDNIIEKTKASIEEYKKLRQAVITQAVTKGVRGDRPMKDSGIEWIGEIPEEWTLTKVRYIGALQNGISKGGDYFGEGFPFVSYGDVYKNYSIPQNVNGLVRTTEDERKQYSVISGDIFFTRTSETIEEVGFSAVCEKTIENATFAGFVIRLRPYEEDSLILTSYAKYYFRGEQIRKYLVKEMNLVTRASLGQGLLNAMSVLIPPMNEQQEIAEYLDKKCTEIDSLISKKEQFLTELESYKKSMIYEYVTGKKEVPQS